jgi:hypothetical protein
MLAVKLLLGAGGALIVFGLILLSSGKFPFIGKIPGDIFIGKEGRYFFYFPIATCVITSIVLSAILGVAIWLLR